MKERKNLIEKYPVQCIHKSDDMSREQNHEQSFTLWCDNRLHRKQEFPHGWCHGGHEEFRHGRHTFPPVKTISFFPTNGIFKKILMKKGIFYCGFSFFTKLYDGTKIHAKNPPKPTKTHQNPSNFIRNAVKHTLVWWILGSDRESRRACHSANETDTTPGPVGCTPPRHLKSSVPTASPF